MTPRAPLQLPGSPGRHWYLVSRVGYPDPDSLRSAFAQLAALHDELWQRTGIGPERTVLGGFSMGTAMSYALGLDGLRPAPGGIPRLLWVHSKRRRVAAGPGEPPGAARVHRPRQSRDAVIDVQLRPPCARRASRRRPRGRLPRVRGRIFITIDPRADPRGRWRGSRPTLPSR